MPRLAGHDVRLEPAVRDGGGGRDLFGNPGIGGDSWVAQHPLLLAVVWPVVLTLIFAPLAVRRYQRLSR